MLQDAPAPATARIHTELGLSPFAPLTGSSIDFFLALATLPALPNDVALRQVPHTTLRSIVMATPSSGFFTTFFVFLFLFFFLLPI